ncbi:MAG: nitroreductase family protein [Rikenellaceae bacterium]
MENSVLNAIINRYSCRLFTDKKVEISLLKEVVRAGMAAPTAKNMQPWEFMIVDEREKLDALSSALPFAKMLTTAQAAIVVCGVDENCEGGSPYWVVDCAAATENILLAAQAVGLAAVWTAVYPYKERLDPTYNILDIPQTAIPLCVIPIGYAAREARVKDKFKEEKIHINQW